jgi:formylglycine-generating enzyme required for sulfatase activity
MKNTVITPLLVVVLFLCSNDAFCKDPEYYIKKGSWQETMQTSREALLEHLIKLDMAKAETMPVFGSWHKIGPFTDEAAFEKEFFPEKDLDLTKEEGKLKWKQINVQDDVVHKIPAPNSSAMYFYRKITASRRQSMVSYYGSDDGLVVWLNGKKIISKNINRRAAEDQESAQLDLKEGENHLLIKICKIDLRSGWYFSTTKNAGAKRKKKAVMRKGLWDLAGRDFDALAARKQMSWERGDNIWLANWKKGDLVDLASRYVGPLKGTSTGGLPQTMAQNVKSQKDLSSLRNAYYQAKAAQDTMAEFSQINLKALRMAVEDLTRSFPDTYPSKYLKRIKEIEAMVKNAGESKKLEIATAVVEFRRQALLANPLLDFDKLLLVKRRGDLGMPQNWVGNCSKRGPFDNEISVLSPVSPDGKLTTLYRPETKAFVGDVDLHWDADKLLFSSQLPNKRYEVFEIKPDGTGLRQVSKTIDAVDNYDACYLPSGKVIYDSTSVLQGVPCVGGGSQVANLHVMNPDGSGVRRLCFDQDHDWYPSILNDGRVIFTRWEYSDTAHYFTRIVMTMNPDGTNQRSYYGSNSYWPNSIFYPRAIPNHPSQFVGIVSGHHGVAREGELIIFDPSKGQHEADGVVQRIPGYGKKVEPVIKDQLVNGSSPRFLHPYPLSSKYFLASCNLNGNWGIYLVDIFDNMLPICVEPGVSMLEPVPFRKTKKPPVIPERVDLSSKDGTVYMSDIYSGDGLKRVPRGTVKKMRLFAFDYGYFRLANHSYIGTEGPWDVHRILGTVDVEPDGSASFQVPANTPIALQPLDEEGKAIQLMRSWLVAMPGENLTCIGCHEDNKTAPRPILTAASRKSPQKINDWYGPARGFSFRREVQPAVDKFCIGCHDGTADKDGNKLVDMRDKGETGFSLAYKILQRYVRRPGPEGDYHMYQPTEYDADTSPLIQMLKKGHHGVKPDREAYERLYTWIDLNVPYYGTWGEFRKIPYDQDKRRLEFRKKFACLDKDYEVIPVMNTKKIEPIIPVQPKPVKAVAVKVANWPFDDAEAKKRQGDEKTQKLAVDIDGQILDLEMVRIPAGEFVMGDAAGARDEQPVCAVKIDKPFWIANRAVLNEAYALFDAKHDSGYLDLGGKDQSTRGKPLNKPDQRVVRVSWERAMAFCEWLSKKTGKRFSLPTEAQWEYAARAGATANQSGSNAWGVEVTKGGPEWTRSTYQPYPYNPADGRDTGDNKGRKVVRGAKGIKVPADRIDTYRLSYKYWQPVWDVGFRIVCED